MMGVMLYCAAFATGVLGPTVNAMASVYMTITVLCLTIALRFLYPTQLLSRVEEQPV